MSTKSTQRLRRGDKVNLYGDVGHVVSVRGRFADVLFTGKQADGRFGGIQGGLSVLQANLVLMERGPN